MEFENFSLRREILTELSSARYSLQISDLHCKLGGSPIELQAVLRNLAEDGLVKDLNHDSVVFQITDRGLEALTVLKEMARKEAKQQAQQRFENKVSVASVLVPTVTFFIGLVVEHYAGLLRFLGL